MTAGAREIDTERGEGHAGTRLLPRPSRDVRAKAERPVPGRRRFAAVGLFLWLLVAFGLLNANLPRARLAVVSLTVADGRMPTLVEAIRAYYTNEGDLRRYFAYAEAALGRPYESYFVRSAAEWRRAFSLGEGYEPDARPTLAPARPLVPYRDFLVEYPPGFFLVALPPAWLARDGRSYVLLFQTLMAAALTAALVLMARAARHIGSEMASRRLLAWAALGTLALGAVATHRYDAAVALSMALAAWAIVRRHAVALGFALAVAVSLKGVPLLAVPPVVMLALRERRTRMLAIATAAAAIVGTVIALPAILVAGRSLVEMVRYHAERPIQIETIWGGVLGLLHAVDPASVAVEKTFGSTNLVGQFCAGLIVVCDLVMGLGLAAVYLATWRRLEGAGPVERSRVTLEGIAASLGVYIACAKVSSPQYLVWLLPLGLMLSLASQRRRSLALLLATLTVTQIVYPIAYGSLESLRPWACTLVIVRNFLLLGWVRSLLSRQVRARSGLYATGLSWPVVAPPAPSRAARAP